MAIVIKEIILSDNLEKFMEKVNFNFDQLLLAGGGPPGPIGPIGLIGPGGPKGDPGNKWYVGPSADEPAIGVTLEVGDLFLSSGDGINPLGIKGEVYQWDITGTQFDDTGLNLIGPSGPPGIAGANLGWNVYGGDDQGMYIPFTLDLVGPTANFHFLKGDTLTANVFGTTAMSLDTLWLGGLADAQSAATIYPLENLPKIFVAPRTTLNSEDPVNIAQGFAHSGIALGVGSATGTLIDALPNSFSNILVDTNMNLRITNFTNFSAASSPVAGVDDNNIFIESMQNVTLVGDGYYAGNGNELSSGTKASVQVGSGLTGINDWTNTPTLSGVIIKSTGTFDSQQIVQVELEDSDLFRVIGGGKGDFVNPSMDGGDSSIQLYTDKTSDLIDGFYSISIAGRDVPDFTATGASYGRIIAGYNNTSYADGDRDWIGLATWTGTSNSATLIAMDQKIHIGFIGNINSGANSLADMPSRSLNVMGQIRMARGEGTAGQILVSEDAYGKMEWSSLNVSDIIAGNGSPNKIAFWDGSKSLNECSGTGVPATDSRMEWSESGGVFKLFYETPSVGLGKILTSDAVGYADWEDLPPSTQVDVYNQQGFAQFWVKPVGAKTVEVTCIGGGGGGAGGGAQSNINTEVSGGGGGQGAGYSKQTYKADDIDTTATISVGAGGAGGAGGSRVINNSNIMVVFQPGNGGVGSDSSFDSANPINPALDGVYIRAQAGIGGVGGVAADAYGAGNIYRGGAGKEQQPSTGTSYWPDPPQTFGPPSGGGAGGNSGTGALNAVNGTNGGEIWPTEIAGGLGGGAAAVGAVGNTRTSTHPGSGGGGGGGTTDPIMGLYISSGKNGGDGGLYGGGGGGGGAISGNVKSVNKGQGVRGGRGGAGADGLVVVITHF
jgi:hypothetical protein